MSVTTHREVELELVVAEKVEVAEGVVQLRLRLADGGELPEWQPGAHIDIVVDADLDRQYSLCGDPAVRDEWVVAVLREPESRGGSSFVHDSLATGSRVTVRGPRNHFALEPAPTYVFIAGGIGITPIRAMIGQAEADGADWTLWYGGRTASTMAFTSDLARHGDRVRIWPQDERDLLPLDDILGQPAADTLVYCCGPEPLLVEVEKRCVEWPDAALHLERFTPKQIEAFDPDSPFVVECTESGLELTVNPGETILDVLVDHGIDVETSCTEGICGTCETRVLGGVPDHLDSILSPAEQEAGDTMFVCVSRSRSPRLVIER